MLTNGLIMSKFLLMLAQNPRKILFLCWHQQKIGKQWHQYFL